jgi:peptide/nickel transport system substrate-binding protein
VAALSAALEQASQRALTPTAQLASEQSVRSPAVAPGYDTVAVAPSHPVLPTEASPSADLSAGTLEPTVYPGSSSPNGHDTPQSGTVAETPQRGQFVAPTAAVVPAPLEPPMPVQQKARHLPRTSAALLIGLVIIAGGILGSVSLLAHFGVIGAHSGATTPTVVRGGIWTDDFVGDPDSLIPNGGLQEASALIDQALYLPLFYGDAQGVVHPAAATEVPTVQNGDISADAKTWTFHLRPHLVWSDGQPYDARDVDYTWRLWKSPKFGAANPMGSLGLDLISGAEVSADHLSITFHLKQAYAPFLSLWWVDGILAPLPAHHFSAMAPEAILKSPDNLNPQITSGPFLMSESMPGDHYTLVRNPNYYLASQGLPYLEKVIFRIVDRDTLLKDLQADTITSAWLEDVRQVPVYQRLSNYTLVTPPTDSAFEAMYFNFHNTVLASHLEVRQAMAMAIDHQALIEVARHGIASPLCTDHGSALHPGYQPDVGCPVFDPAAANKLLDDYGWVKGPDGVRTRGGQRLEFEYSTALSVNPYRLDAEAIIERNFKAIGIQLAIQNYPGDMFFGSLLPGGKASPPTGAVAGRYDIAEFAVNFGYDPDDSSLLSCDQIPPKGASNIDFYCNPTLDALYKQELATADPGLRQQLFKQIHQIYLTELPFIVLFGAPIDFAMVRKGTHNYQHGSIEGGTINIWQWWCDTGQC